MRSILWVLILLALSPIQARAEVPATPPPQGIRQHIPTTHAFVDATLVLAPGRVVQHGTLVIRDGLIVAAGANLNPPPDARLWHATGQWIYPGLCDAYGEVDVPNPSADSSARYWNPHIAAELDLAESYRPDESTTVSLRKQGVTSRLITPAAGIVKGFGLIASTADQGPQILLHQPAALFLRLTPTRGSNRDDYPTSPMGALTLVRQAFYDARWHAQALALYRGRDNVPRPEDNLTLAALGRALAAELPVVIDAPDEFYFLRAAALGNEFGLSVVIRGSGREYRRLAAVHDTGRAVILPLDFPPPPDVRTPQAARNTTLERLWHWDLAPENPARLAQAGVRIAFTSHGLKDRATFLSAIRKAVARGLSAEDALQALTVTPAALFGLERRLATLEPGKLAHFLIADGELFAAKTQVLETWIDGTRYIAAEPPTYDPRGTWQFTLTLAENQTVSATLDITGESPTAKLSGKLRDAERTVDWKPVALDRERWDWTVSGALWQLDGILQATGNISAAGDELLWTGQVVLPSGQTRTATARRSKNQPPVATPSVEATPTPPPARSDSAPAIIRPTSRPTVQAVDTPTAPDAEPAPIPKSTPAAIPPSEQVPATPAVLPATPTDTPTVQPAPPDGQPPPPQRALFEPNAPLGALGVDQTSEQPVLLAFRHATVWTCGPQGTLTDATVLVAAGKIVAVGHTVDVPADAQVIDATGLHITPGIIDCHSHIATDGGINESGQAVTAEVRIGDFIDADDPNIYRQLAGGVTCVNVLHGSANPIGGQNQVLKLRWGALPEELKFAGAPPGIKFALGENVKQSNWGDKFTTRYPQTRMGVDEIIRDTLRAARDYRRQHEAWTQHARGLPPRTDLELEAVAEILAGRRLIHCHSYRQDEILALLRTCQEFGVRIATLQHILEGYKLADEMARQGVAGSSFSDWWAYKFEVIDAIPYNGALMHQAGVLVSFNSDDAELARRLNLEAAKAIKYGNLSPEDALRFVTLNPARQLHIDDRVGSLEPGKDADLVLWNGSPLSCLSRCEQTWIDGRRYFDRQLDVDRRQEAARRKAALIQRALASDESPESPDNVTPAEKDRWPREDLFCGRHTHDLLHHDAQHLHSAAQGKRP